MADKKTRREFLQKASLAGVALVAGSAALSGEGCGTSKETSTAQVSRVTGGGSSAPVPDSTAVPAGSLVVPATIDQDGVISISDPVASQRLLDTLKQNRKLTDLDSSGTIQFNQSEKVMRTRSNKGIQVIFTANDVDQGIVPVNSLCGCNTKC